MDIFTYIDIIFFIYCTFSVLYLLLFSFFSIIERTDKFNAKLKNRFAIIIPVYEDNEFILEAYDSILNQDYPIDCYDTYIVCDHVDEATINQLKGKGANIIIANFEKSSKTKSLKLAINYIDENRYDISLILNSDCIIDNDFLSKINDTFSIDFNAIQCHRIHKNRKSNVSIIDAVSDEINNSIFRRGHVSIGLSSSLCGTGMAFDYSWFKNNINKLEDYQDEKAIESLLLKDNIFIDYLDDTHLYTLKSDNKKRFYKQRSNWIYSHYSSFFKNIKFLPSAIFKGNFDYADRIFQWSIFPRSILIVTLLFFSILTTYLDWTLSLKWWLIIFAFMLSFAFATPNYLIDKKFNKAMFSLPFVGIGLIFKMIFKNK